MWAHRGSLGGGGLLVLVVAWVHTLALQVLVAGMEHTVVLQVLCWACVEGSPGESVYFN